MLNALYELGKTYIEKKNFNEMNILLGKWNNPGAVLLVEFEKNRENISYLGVKEREYSQSDEYLYLYKKGSSRGTDLTPSAIITEVDKTFENKFIKWFKDNEKDVLVKGLLNVIEANKEQILNDIEAKNSELDSKKNNLLTISIKENNETKYLYDYEIFKNSFIEKANEKYYKKLEKGRGECLLCGEEKELFPLVANAVGFSFSTVDKPGNIQELSKSNQWKMVPICEDCALYLESGNKFVDTYLSFSEFGLKYYVIPSFLSKKDDIIDKLFDYYLKELKDRYSYYNTLAPEEDDLIADIDDLDNSVKFKFFFYKKSNSAFNILGNVESVVPSWINKLIVTQKALIKNKLFEEDYVKEIINMGKDKKKEFSGDFLTLYNSNRDYNNVKPSNWIFGFLRDFFSFNENNGYYISIVSSIFSGEKVNFDFILSYALKKIRYNFRQDSNYFVEIATIELLLTLKFIENLNLNLNGENMTDLVKNIENIESKEDSELVKYMEELNTPAKKASFLLGVLTRKLISKQFKELGSTPFTNKLWGMSLDENKIQKLYPMVINKLNEYKIAYTELYQEISENLLKSTNNWKLTRDETSFYFILGYTLFRLYKKPKKEHNDEENLNDKD